MLADDAERCSIVAALRRGFRTSLSLDLMPAVFAGT